MKKFVYLILLTICFVLYALTIRGNVGLQSPSEVIKEARKPGTPFESSQEGARYAMMLSFYEDHSFNIDKYVELGVPDVGRINHHYYSLFPPTVSILAVPFYMVGRAIHATQMSVFSVSTFFAILTMLLIVRFALRLKLHWSIALFSAIAFGFATNAWGYSVTFYAHLVSAFLILLALYLTSFLDGKFTGLKALGVWVLYAFGVFVDFPNGFIFLPIVLMLTYKAFSVLKKEQGYLLHLNWKILLAPIIFVILMAGYGYYNYHFFGNPVKLSNTLPRVATLQHIGLEVPKNASYNPNRSTPFSALKARSLLNGIQSFTISTDRSVLFFSPIVLLFVFGIGYLAYEKRFIELGLLAIPATTLILYSTFDDPYGGWAFGSRYLIAAMPELCLLAGIGLQRFAKNIWMRLVYTGVFAYSLGVSLLAPLTTNIISPIVEGRLSGLDSFYTLNIHMIQQNNLNSFVYNYIFNKDISGVMYYWIIFAIVFIIGAALIWYPKEKI